jgi:hypothetical protein
MTQEHRELLIRHKAKLFKKSFDGNTQLAQCVPDELIDSLTQKDAKVFFQILNQIGLVQSRIGGFWELKS